MVEELFYRRQQRSQRKKRGRIFLSLLPPVITVSSFWCPVMAALRLVSSVVLSSFLDVPVAPSLLEEGAAGGADARPLGSLPRSRFAVGIVTREVEELVP